MIHRLMIGAAEAAMLTLSPAAFAQQGALGTPKKPGPCWIKLLPPRRRTKP